MKKNYFFSKRHFKPLLCSLAMMMGSTTLFAQTPGNPGVDPNAVTMLDFEDGTTGGWTTSTANRGEVVTVEMMDAQKGDPVKYGRYAAKININFLNALAEQTLVAQFSPGKTTDKLQIPGNDVGGKKLGMWVYATAGVEGMWFRVGTRPIGSTSGVTNTDFAAKVNWTGWKYVELKLPAGHEFHPNGIRLLVLKSYTNYYVNGYVIFDNIRVTNQSVQEDITSPTIKTFTLNGGAVSGTINTSKITLAASLSDEGGSGLDLSSAKFIIDGEAYQAGSNGFTANDADNSASLTGLKLAYGEHSIECTVQDGFGNIATQSGKITVDATDGIATTITTAIDDKAKVGQPYQIKINTNNSQDVKQLDIVMEMNNIGSVASTGGVIFAESAAGSTYSYDARTSQLTISIKNDVTAALTETLATINVNVSKASYPTDVLRCTPVEAKATYADGTSSGFSLFDAFEKPVESDFTYTVLNRVVGLPGQIKVTEFDGTPISGATVVALTQDLTSEVCTGTTNAEGIADNMPFTSTAQSVCVYATKDNRYSYTNQVVTLKPLLDAAPTYIRSGATANPKTEKALSWMANPVTSTGKAYVKLALKSEGEAAFRQIEGRTKVLEYNAVVSNGAALASAANLTDLQPGATYIYQVGDGENWSSTREFTTASDTNKFSFNAFGDLQATSTAHMAYFVNAGKTIGAYETPSFFNINVGDVIDGDDRYDCYSYYGYLMNQCPEFASVDMLSGYGNHEYMGNPDADNVKFVNNHHCADPNNSLLGTGTYYSIYGNLLVVQLDWEHRGGATYTEIINAYASWIDKICTEHPEVTWKVASIHYPIFPSNFTPGAPEILGGAFERNGFQLIICGHGHTYERVQVRNGAVISGSDRRTFTPVIGSPIHMQIGDMRADRVNNSTRWFHMNVDGIKMDVDVYNTQNNTKVDGESFTIYAKDPEEAGIGDNLNATRVAVYPNPADAFTTVVGAKGAKLDIISATGSVVASTAITEDSQTVNVNGLAAGMYFFRISKSDSVKIHKVFVK